MSLTSEFFSYVPYKRIFGSPESVKPTFSAIYNSLRYDVDDRTLTFHLRREDWNELKSNSWMWISSDDLGIIREDVRLEEKIVKSVTCVDPVEKFGLSSVQTFAVTESIESCQVLEVSFRYARSNLGHFSMHY